MKTSYRCIDLLNIIIFFFLLGSSSIAQTEINEWGLGIISSIITPNKSEIINFPIGSLKVFDNPNGNQIGTIIKDKEYDPYYYNVLLNLNTNSDNIKVKREDLREVTYEGTCLKYYDNKDGFLKILIYTHENGVWINSIKLKFNDFEPIHWQEFLVEKGKGFIPYQDRKIKLQEKPSLKSNTILEIQGRGYRIDLIGRQNGDWFEVTVNEYDLSDEFKKNTIGTYTGWMQIVDDEKHPVIWYYTRGM